MQAIHTFILPATNLKPTRIKAQCQAKSRIYSVQDEWGWADQEQHAYAAEKLAQDLGWWDHGIWVSGCLKDGSYAHCCQEKAR